MGVLLGVGDDSGDDIGVIVDLEIEPPALSDAGLPEVQAFVVLLGVQRRVLQVVSQKAHLFVESFSDLLLQAVVVYFGAVRVLPLHRLRFFLCRGWLWWPALREASSSSTVSNFGETRPLRMSSRPSASWASMMRQHSDRSKIDYDSLLPLHRLRFFLCRGWLWWPALREASSSSTVSNFGETRPLRMSSRPSASWASMMRRWAGVYSSSAVGNLVRSITSWGVMTIFLPTARTSTRSPSTRPTAERTLRGMVIWPLGWTLTRVLIGFRALRKIRTPAGSIAGGLALSSF